MTHRPMAAAIVRIAAVVCVAAAFVGSAAPAEKQVTFSILEDYDKGEDLNDVARDFALFRDLGITTWRGSFGWDDYEPARGEYDFDWLHRFADLANEYGITLRPYIGYTPAWAAAGGADKDAWNDPPRNLDDWTAFVRTLAAAMRRHRNIASYEIYNEENVAQWWDGPASAYATVLDRAARAIAEASPGTPVLLGGMVYPDVNWIRSVCVDGHDAARIAVVPFHAYPETWTPPDADVERYLGPHFADGFVNAVDRDCGSKPIWINETGFATVEGKTEEQQADWWTRAMATFVAEPRIEHIGVYEIKDLKPDRPAIGDVPNYHLGITYADRRKKLAFATIKDLVALLHVPLARDDAARVVPSDSGCDRLYDRTFRRHDGREVVFVWTKGGACNVDIHVGARARRAIEHRLDGMTGRYASFDGRTIAHVRVEAGHARTFELVR